ncbi:MAG: relaxase/mobilization nuclease domain-containing protein [Prevotella sp.]
MIITILPSSTSFHAIAYNERKVEKGQAVLLEAANINGLRPEAYTADKLRQYFERYSSRNTRIQNAQFHVAVSCKGDEYTHEQLLDIAHRYLREMGYAEEGQPLLVYAHNDTPNNHIHIITSRVAPDGHRISDRFEKKRSREITERIMREYQGQSVGQDLPLVSGEGWGEIFLSYRFSSKAQFYAILESQGYDCKEDDSRPVACFYKNNELQGELPLQEILRHAVSDNRPDDRRRRQLRAILKKYRDMSGGKDELAAHMKRRFGISLVWLGRSDTPYGYILVDHKNKSVYKGGEFLSVRELLHFEDAPTRFARISETIDSLLADNPSLTTADINRVLYRQFGTRIHRGTITWGGETVTLREEVVRQLHDNYLASRGIRQHDRTVTVPTVRQSQSASPARPMAQGASSAGSSDTNREWEIGGMDMSVDDESSQRAKWRR